MLFCCLRWYWYAKAFCHKQDSLCVALHHPPSAIKKRCCLVLSARSVTNMPRSCGILFTTPDGCTIDNTWRSRIQVKNSNFFVPNLHSTPPLGGSLSEYCQNTWYAKTRMVWLSDGEKLWTCLLMHSIVQQKQIDSPWFPPFSSIFQIIYSKNTHANAVS